MINHYKSIIEKSPIGYAYHKMIYNEEGIPCDYEFVELNFAFERLSGLKGPDIIGRRITEIMPGITESGFDWIKTYGEISLYGGSKEFEQFSENLSRWYRVYAYSPMKNYFITWVTDISKEVLELEQKTIMLTSMNDAIFELDTEYTFNNIIVSNEAYLFMPREAIIGRRIDELFTEELAAVLISVFKIAAVSGQKEHVKYKSPIQDDNRWFEAEIFLHNTGTGEKRYIVSISEITEQKKIEDALVNKTEELERFFDINLDLLCIADIEGNFIKVNNAWEKILGYSVAELERRKFFEFVHPEDMDATLDSISRLSNNEQVLYFVNRCKCTDGSYRYIEWCSQPYMGLIYASARDITDRKLAEQALKVSEERFNIAVEGTRAGLWDWDMKSNTVYYSPQWKSMLGYEQDEIESTFNGWKNLWHPEDIERIEQAIANYISGKTELYEIDHRLRCKNGDWRWILTRGELLKDSKGEPYRWIGTNIDITNIKEAEEKIRYLSFHDQLTGLYNRRFYEEELNRLDAERNLPLSLIMADINGLKLVNDAFGHLVGDELLKKAAEVIKSECRSDEIVSRIGGDEFVIILPKVDSFGAESLVKRIKKSIGNEKVNLLDLSVSIGWATKTHPMQVVEDIFNKAENNMYNQKLYESPRMKEKAIKTILAGMYERFPEEKIHAERVSKLCEAIGRQLGLSEEDIEEIKTAGLMHDIGKITLNENILYKPGKLNDSEWIDIKHHTETGYMILGSFNDMAQIAKYILYHHERWSGSGYPNGLKGEEIPLQSRIIGIADAYDAMASERPYRKALSKNEIIKEIEENAGTQFDPGIARIFIDNILVKL